MRSRVPVTRCSDLPESTRRTDAPSGSPPRHHERPEAPRRCHCGGVEGGVLSPDRAPIYQCAGEVPLFATVDGEFARLGEVRGGKFRILGDATGTLVRVAFPGGPVPAEGVGFVMPHTVRGCPSRAQTRRNPAGRPSSL
jgi:hypothetical protein